MKSTLAPVTSLLTGVGLLIAGFGLQLTLIPLYASAEGWTDLQIGVIGSAYYFGFVAGCFGAPLVILRAGHIRAFTAMVSLATATIIAHPLIPDFIPWLIFRLIIGACLAGLSMIIESWLNDRATNATRGLVMSAYIIVNFGALTVGQLTVTLYPPTGFELFAIAAIATVLAAIPVAITRSAQPAPISTFRIRPARLYRASPVGLVGVMLIGVANGAFWALGAVSAIGAGMTAAEATIFVSIATASGALAQWPAGRLSDFIDRRLVLISLLLLATLSGLILALVPLNDTGLFVMAALFGMTTLPTYSVAAAHAYDHAEHGSYVETAAGILLANAAGSIIGPLLAALLMGWTGPMMLFLFIAAVQASLAVYAFVRLKLRPPPTATEKTDFDFAATAAVGSAMSPELPDPDDSLVVVPPPQDEEAGLDDDEPSATQ